MQLLVFLKDKVVLDDALVGLDRDPPQYLRLLVLQQGFTHQAEFLPDHADVRVIGMDKLHQAIYQADYRALGG